MKISVERTIQIRKYEPLRIRVEEIETFADLDYVISTISELIKFINRGEDPDGS